AVRRRRDHVPGGTSGAGDREQTTPVAAKDRMVERQVAVGGGGGAGAAGRPCCCWACAWACEASCRACSTFLDTFSGWPTPAKAKSESSVPAVSKSTVPTWRIRSITPWSVLTFWIRSTRV